jgi:hypothetical protein
MGMGAAAAGAGGLASGGQSTASAARAVTPGRTFSEVTPSGAVKVRPMYRSLKFAAMFLNGLSLFMLLLTVLQVISWQRGTLPHVFGSSGYKVIYALQVGLPLALCGLCWGVAQCCTAARELLRR